MRAAILDLGTNTFHLLIVEIDNDNRIRELVKTSADSRLGEGGINAGIINATAFDRALRILEGFADKIAEYNVDKVRAFGTAALRTATNGAEFIAAVKQKTGISIELITGDQEAEYIWHGVKHAVNITQTSLIMDIGGGSVEFIICNPYKILWKKSYPIGAARLMAAFHHSDPISEPDISAIHHFLDNTLQDLRQQITLYKPQILIGSAGTFETYATLVIRKFQHPTPDVKATSYSFSIQEFDAIANYIIRSNHQQRAADQDIIPVRVDMIVVATVLTSYILKTGHINHIVLSLFSLKEGVLYNMLSNSPNV
ncbi:exopolyphosphatase [Pedobacter sp. BS3]|uniref:Ppx/GppA phosphatase family protein n=1 Tax=Pedobacter sp. BS3 TaxID=2567937 RepID=UPI0011ED4F96|nr:exopolyphosphatase [Pedobacter sp. BS3]TZF82656.1 exopolyphosphatase [Pedobacter sp. BS3]